MDLLRKHMQQLEEKYNVQAQEAVTTQRRCLKLLRYKKQYEVAAGSIAQVSA